MTFKVLILIIIGMGRAGCCRPCMQLVWAWAWVCLVLH